MIVFVLRGSNPRKKRSNAATFRKFVLMLDQEHFFRPLSLSCALAMTMQLAQATRQSAPRRRLVIIVNELGCYGSDQPENPKKEEAIG